MRDQSFHEPEDSTDRVTMYMIVKLQIDQITPLQEQFWFWKLPCYNVWSVISVLNAQLNKKTPQTVSE